MAGVRADAPGPFPMPHPERAVPVNAVSAPEAAAARSRSDRLSAATDALHEQLHGLVAAADPFGARARYATWVGVQYRYHGEIEPLYRLPVLQSVVPDLGERGRVAAAAADLADLGQPLPALAPRDPAGVSVPEALGWLFVAEGSTLGAAVLLKRAQALGMSETHGARHLAAAPEGRARHWKAFVTALDALELDEAQERALVAAALAAFRRFAALIAEAYRLLA